jgi:DNA modification methylase
MAEPGQSQSANRSKLRGARDRFDVADASTLPWPDGSVDLIVTSPPLSNSITESLGYVAVRNGSGIGTGSAAR